MTVKPRWCGDSICLWRPRSEGIKRFQLKIPKSRTHFYWVGKELNLPIRSMKKVKGTRILSTRYSALSSLLFRGKNAVHNKKMKEGRKERKIMGRLLYYRTESISRKSSWNGTRVHGHERFENLRVIAVEYWLAIEVVALDKQRLRFFKPSHVPGRCIVSVQVERMQLQTTKVKGLAVGLKGVDCQRFREINHVVLPRILKLIFLD